MDLATIIGIVTGFGLIIMAVASGGGIAWFADGPSALIVFGGIFGAVLIHYPLSTVFRVMSVAKNVFFKKGQDPEQVIRLLVDMSRVSRREGLLSLQKMTPRLRDPFFAKGVQLMVDGIEPEALESILETELESVAERHRLGAEIFTTMGNFAPAMGMTGTLIGLVKMLMQMNDPSTIGPSMSVAFVSTFYGVILANLVFYPVAGKLRMQSAQEQLVKQLIIGGILSVQNGNNPRVVEQKLHSFISPKKRKTVF